VPLTGSGVRGSFLREGDHRLRWSMSGGKVWEGSSALYIRHKNEKHHQGLRTACTVAFVFAA
jgi:hypothetical protein